MAIRKRVTPRKQARKTRIAEASKTISMLTEGLMDGSVKVGLGAVSPTPPPGIYAIQYMDGSGGLARRILTYANTTEAPIGKWTAFSYKADKNNQYGDLDYEMDMSRVAHIQGPLPEFPPIVIPDFTIASK